MTALGWTSALIGRALLRPRVGLDLVALCWSFRRRRWWTRSPFLPVPDCDYLAWRLYTAYGDEDTLPPAADLVRFARWRREILSL
jgi:hypothetical protein